MANSAASTLIGYMENIAKIDSSTIGLAGVETTMLLNIIDKANREYYNKFILGGGEPKTDRTAETGGAVVDGTALAEDVTTATTDFDVDSATDLASSGALAVYDDERADYVEYTGKSSNNLTGVTGIDYSHEDGDAVYRLYALPSNFESFRSADDNPDGVTVDGIPYRFVSGDPVGNTFAVYDNGTTKYLHFPRGVTGDYSVRYNKGATSIAAAATTVDVPIADEDFIVYRGVEHIYRILNVDQFKVQEARAMADKILLDALKRRNVGKRLRHGRTFNVNGSRRFPASEAVNQFYV